MRMRVSRGCFDFIHILPAGLLAGLAAAAQRQRGLEATASICWIGVHKLQQARGSGVRGTPPVEPTAVIFQTGLLF